MTHGHGAHHPPHTKDEFEHELVDHDQWFRHSPEEPHHKAAQGGTNTWIINLFLFGTVVFVAVVFVLVMALFRQEVGRFKVLQQEQIPISNEFAGLRADWEARLSSCEWVDPQAGRVRVPLSLAKQIVIDEYKAAAAPKK